MSITTKKAKGIDYLYFQAGVGKTIYLGPKNDISKIKPDNVLRALDYVIDRFDNYSEIENNLISFLPQKQKDQYISKRLKELDKNSDKELLSHLSEDGQRKYLEMRDEDLRTKLRLPEEEILDYVEVSPNNKITKQILNNITKKDYLDIASGKTVNFLYKMSQDTISLLIKEEGTIDRVLGFQMKSFDKKKTERTKKKSEKKK